MTSHNKAFSAPTPLRVGLAAAEPEGVKEAPGSSVFLTGALQTPGVELKS